MHVCFKLTSNISNIVWLNIQTYIIEKKITYNKEACTAYHQLYVNQQF